MVHLDEDGRVTRVTGVPESPLSRGYLCAKGSSSPELLYHPDRLTKPLRRVGERGEDRWQAVSWDVALDEMSTRLDLVRRESGPEYFAMIHGTGRGYIDLAARFTNAFGSPNLVHPGHICMGPRAMASLFTIGTPQMPASDLFGLGDEAPACLLLWGSNAIGNGSIQGMCAGAVTRAIKGAKRVVVVDPRRVGAAREADQWLQIRPGTDGALALAMIHVIVTEQLFDRDFVEQHTTGFEALATHVRELSPEWAAPITRLRAEDIRQAARSYATVRPGCIVWGAAIEMSTCSFHTARSLMMLRALTGNLDRPGGDVLWVPPQGVRMKSQYVNREISGQLLLPLDRYRLALDCTRAAEARKWQGRVAGVGLKIADGIKRAAYRRIADRVAKAPLAPSAARLARLRSARYPLSPTVHPPTFWRAVLSGEPYRPRALWVMGSNPVVTARDTVDIEQALRALEYLVVSDLFMTPTAQLADLVLPASSWLERDDIVNYAKQWCLPVQRKLAQIGEARDDRDVMLQLAGRLGMRDALPWESHADFLAWMLADSGTTFAQLAEQPLLTGTMRYRKYQREGFATPSGKLELYSETLRQMGIEPLPVYRPSEPPPESVGDYPLLLISGVRAIGYFHSEQRQLPSARRRNPDPIVEIHPATAAALGIGEGEWAWIETRHGKVQMRARLFDGIAEDVIAAQHGWWFPEAKPPGYDHERVNINRVIKDLPYDPDIGSEPLRSVRCRLSRVGALE